MKSLSSAVVVFAGVYGMINIRAIGAGDFTVIFLAAFTVAAVMGFLRFWESTASNKPANQQILPYIVPAPRGNPGAHKPAPPQKTSTPPPLNPEFH